MACEITATIKVKAIPRKEAPMMLHEQVATGTIGAKEFRIIRDFTGLHWQVHIGEDAAVFSLNDALQEIVTQIVTTKEILA